MYKLNPWHRMVYFDAAGGGGEGGGGGGGAIDAANPEVVKLVAAAVAEATKGLKAKNDEILGEKKKIEEQFAGLDGKAVRELMDRINADEDMKLFTSGKREDYDKRITGRMEATYVNQIKARDDKIVDLEKTLKERGTKLADTLRDSAIQAAAAKIGVVASAIPDVLGRARSVFSVDDDAHVVARDVNGGVIMGADGKKPLDAESWIKGLKDEAPHLFPLSKGGGAGGGGGKLNGTDDLSALPPTERLRIARERQAAGLR